MEKLIKTRKIHACSFCHKTIYKGSKAINKKHTQFYFDEDDQKQCFLTFSHYYHLKCNYNKQRAEERFKDFVKNCHHPKRIEEYSYIPGEAVQQPEGTRCLICNDLF